MKKTKRKLNKIKNEILDILYPPRCTGCGEVLIKGMMCESCKRSILPMKKPICRKCGSSLCDHDALECDPISAQVIGVYYYGGAVKKMILELKNGKNDRILDEMFGDLCDRISEEYSDIDFDMTVCVPSYYKEEHNASAVIAKRISESYALDFDENTLEKYRKTRKQHTLTQGERMDNVKNSIRVLEGKEEYVRGKTVLLCDDVKSTGSTLDECCKALYLSGAKKVCCVCIAVSEYIKDMAK